MLTVRDLARLADVAERTVREAVWADDIPHTRHDNGRISFEDTEIARWLATSPRARRWFRSHERRRSTPARRELGADPTFLELSEYVLWLSQATLKPSVLETKESCFRCHLRPAFGSARVRDIDYRSIREYTAAKIEQGLSPKTVFNQLSVLRSALNVARKSGVIRDVPEIEWPRLSPSPFDFLTFAESAALLEAAEPWWATMILLALRTGLRQGEILALRWQDVGEDRLHVRRSIARGQVTEPKTARFRTVPLSEQLEAHPRRGKLVFADDDGNVLGRHRCKFPLWRACDAADIRRVRWHVLRHTFASQLVMRGVPLRVVQELMGHATIEMTVRYSHLSPEINADAVALLDPPSV